MKKAAFFTVGCKVNQYETEAIAEMFAQKGYEIVDNSQAADVYVINTCAVTSISARKSRQIIRRALKQNPNSVVAVTGCYAQVASDEVEKIDGVSIIVGTKDRKKIVELCENASKEKLLNAVGDVMHNHTFEELPLNTYRERTRAYIKVQDGCNQFCTYCIIPYARGPVRSRRMEEVLDEIRRVADNGFSEVVLTGIHVASYGIDLENLTLCDLVSAAEQVEGVERIRLSSIEPMTLDDVFVQRVKNSKKLCHHFHLSLQSGCDETLKRMGRRYTVGQYRTIVDGLRAAFPDVAITTDIMVGFPGETDAEFEQTKKFVSDIAFADAHIFQYSQREGTPAAKRADQIPPQVKEQRSKEIEKIVKKSRESFEESFLGSEVEVLFEHSLKDKLQYYEGKTSNYLTVVAKSDRDISGEFVNVRLEKLTSDGILGTIV